VALPDQEQGDVPMGYRFVTVLRWAASVAAVLVLSGCGGPKGPDFGTLHPVKGIVTKGGQAVSGGVVQFARDPEQSEFLINSEVSAAGQFNLTTVRTTDSSGERKSGVAAGTYRITYFPPVVDQTTGFLEPVLLPQPISIAGPAEELKIELPGP
jgi:hypothetical protein